MIVAAVAVPFLFIGAIAAAYWCLFGSRASQSVIIEEPPVVIPPPVPYAQPRYVPSHQRMFPFFGFGFRPRYTNNNPWYSRHHRHPANVYTRQTGAPPPYQRHSGPPPVHSQPSAMGQQRVIQQ